MDMDTAFTNSLGIHAPTRKGPLGFEGGREALNNRFVYLVVSPRARGLSVGVNLSPDRQCNFDCVYCDVSRKPTTNGQVVDPDVLAEELEATLARVHQGKVRQLGCFKNLPDELLQLRQVEVSGDGEPTLCPKFADAIQALVHVRAKGQFPFFKIVVMTNASGLDQAGVQVGLKLLVEEDEVWVKLDGGSADYFRQINRPQVGFDRILHNILRVARQRPVVIQTLFPLLQDQEPPDAEIEAYAQRLLELKQQGAMIQSVQIYSASRPSQTSECAHLPLRSLSRIAHQVRDRTQLLVEVF